MKKLLLLIILVITCISFGKNYNEDTDITTEAKGMLRFVWHKYGKYDKKMVLPVTGEGGLGGFDVYFEFTPEDKKTYLNHILIAWPGNTDGRISGKEMYERIIKIGKEIFPDIENEMKKNEWGYISQPVKLTLKPVKLYSGCCASDYFYAEIVKYEKIPSTTVKIPSNMEQGESINRLVSTYDPLQIYSKEGYANIRKGPSEKYDVIEKLSNDEYVSVTQDFGDWKYISYDVNGKTRRGFVHKNQLKTVE